MRDGLNLLLRAANALPATLDVFIRDDDAGWDDGRQLALLDVAAQAGVPMDLAAIPMALSPSLAAELRRRMQAAPQQLAVHQHGCRHDNHQRAGRKAEFGAERTAAEQSADLRLGRAHLQQLLGAGIDPFFTPPWNRCAPCTPFALAALGFAALSRDRGAPAQHALHELPVDVDWSRHQREGGALAVAQALAQAMQARALDGRPLGLMLHHAVMDVDERNTLQVWLSELARHPQLRWCLMRNALAALTVASRSARAAA